VNSIFSGNTARVDGGAIYSSQFSINNTFFGNSATRYAAAIFTAGGSVINSVFYSHATPAIYGSSAFNLYNNFINVSAEIAGVTPISVGNTSPATTSPFVDSPNGNFRLAPSSVAINNGLDVNGGQYH